MPKFSNSYLTEKCVAASAHGDVTWVMSAEGFRVGPGVDFTQVWWIQDAGDLFLGARLSMSLRDGEAADTSVVELWTQESMEGSGILARSFTVAAMPNGVGPTELRTLGVVGVPGRAWGVRARMTSVKERRAMFQLTLFCRHIGQGLIALGAGVT